MSTMTHQVPPHEVEALAALYDACGGMTWTWRRYEALFGAKWNFTVDELTGELLNNPCSSSNTAWQGVTCSLPPSQCSNQTCSVTELDLVQYNLIGTIPLELGNLSNLQQLDLKNNQITGTIPRELGNLRKLNLLRLESNQMSGRIPPELGNLVNLNVLYLGKNQLDETLPAELGSLTKLSMLSLDSNQITGTIPPEMGKLLLLSQVEFYNNLLVGTIPPELGTLTALELLYLNENQLSGTIPAELGNLLELDWLDLDRNQLTGTIPPELGNLKNVDSFDLDRNQLTGTIPPELGSMSKLHYLDLDGNRLTGAIPPEFGNLSNLNYLNLMNNLISGTIAPKLGNLIELLWLAFSSNHITGRIPSELGNVNGLEKVYLGSNQLSGMLPVTLGNITALEWIDLGHNRLTGSIPSSLGMLTLLSSLDFSQNFMSGSLPLQLHSLQAVASMSLFGNRFTGVIPSSLSELTGLEVFDVGDNLLTGSVPSQLGQLSRMKFFILSVNCLDSLIPESVCGMSSVEVLSLNGLGSADDCSNRHHVLPFLSTLVYSSNREGTIPDCVWSLPNLTLFHMAGNGLVGHIRDSQSTFNTQISDFIASHNKLDGVVPFISSSLQYLDVSYNRLTGELTDDNSVNASLQDSSMIAKVNHLSGRVPAISYSMSNLNVLQGNMMSCETVPSNDLHSEGYSCGSSQYNMALYCMGCSVCLAVMALVLAPIFFDRASKLHPELRDRFEMTIMRWASDVVRFRNFILMLLIIILIAFMPLFVLRIVDDDHTYTTHWHLYLWIVSYSFANGATMGYLIIGMWGVAITATWCYFFSPSSTRKGFAIDEDSPHTSASSSSSIDARYRSWVVIGMSFTGNFVLTVGVNALYVLSVMEASLSQPITLLVQLSMSLFRIVSSITLVPWLAKQVPDASRRVFFRVGLLLFNNLVVPCLAISLTSSNCFQELLVPPDSIESTYSYAICSELVLYPTATLCTGYTTVRQDTAPFTPSFVYNYQCMSTLLAAYIPVLLVGFSIQLLLTAVVVVAVELQVFCFEDVPAGSRKMMHGVLWPQYWISRALESGVCLVQEPSQLLRVDSIICIDMLNPLALLLTFGLSSPPLAVLIALVVASRMRMWQWAVFRFVRAVRGAAGLEGSGRSDELLGKLSEACSPTAAALCWSFPLLAVLSMLFSVFVMWDTAAEVSWEAPLLALLLVLFTSGTLHHKARLYEFISCTASSMMAMRQPHPSIEITKPKHTMNPMQKSAES